MLARDLGRPVYAVVSTHIVSWAESRYQKQYKKRGANMVGTQDLRNHGDSPHHARHDYQAMADDVHAFIEEHNLKDVTLIGHSMLVVFRMRQIQG